MRRAAMAALLACLVAAGARAGRLELSGVVFTERAADRVTVRAWAGAARVAGDHGSALEPLAETAVAPGRPWRLALGDARLPLVVEASAPGHVAARRPVLPGEDPELPAVWLPSGVEAVLRVRRPDPRSRAVVWGRADRWPDGATPSGWVAAVPRTVLAPGKDTARVWLPSGAASVTLAAWAEDGAWAVDGSVNARGGGPLRLRLRTGWIRIRVEDRRGRPVRGALVAPLDAPAAATAVTGEDGVARIPAGGGSWTVVARAGSAWGRRTGRGAPDEPLTVTVSEEPAATLTWDEALGPLAVRPTWLPPALLPEPATAGRMTVPVWEPGLVTVWGPGVAARRLSVDPGAGPEIPLDPVPAAVVAGRVVGPDGEPVAGVPVWVRLPDPWPLLYGRATGRAERLVTLPQAVSGPDGSFRVGRLWPAAVRLEARREGFPAARSEELRLARGGAAEVTLRFGPGTWVRLRAVDPEGRPLPGAAARLCPPRGGGILPGFSSPRPACAPAEAEAEETADGEGVVRLDPVNAGTYDLDLHLSGYVRRTLRELEVPAEGLDLGDVALERGRALDGIAVGPDGRPVAHAEVMLSLSPETIAFEPTVVAGDDGRFSIPDLPRSGEVYLQARAEGYVPRPPLRVALPAEDEVRLAMDRERELTGVVVEKESGRPIEGAEVSVAVKRQISLGGAVAGTAFMGVGSARTGADGTFRVGRLGPGSYQLLVSARGRRTLQRTVEIPAEGELGPLTFELEPGLEIVGRVVDADGAPVAGAEVTARRTGGAPGVIPTSRGGRTGGDGRFRLEGLVPGEYRIDARSGDGRAGTATAEAGAEGEVVVRLEEPGALVVRVVDGEGAPVAGATVSGQEPGQPYGGMGRLGVTGSDGTVRVEPATAGPWYLRVEAAGMAPRVEQVDVRTGETAEVEVRLERGGVVEGEVRGLTAEELGRCWIRAGAAEVAPGADGRFRLEGVPTGVTAVHAALVPGGRSRTVTVEVPDDGTPAVVVFDFRAGATISGTVRRGGVGVPGLTVDAALAGHGSGGMTVTGPDGEYEIAGLEEGEYFVAVRDGSGAVLASEDVTVSGDVTLDLDVPAGSISGRVADAETGAPVAGALVRARRVGVPEVTREATVDGGGRFAFDEVPDGEWRLEARDPEGREGRASVTVADGVPVEVTLELAARAPLVLEVTAAGGVRPDWVWVYWAAGGAAGGPVSASCDGGRCPVRGLPEGDLVLVVAGGSGAAVVGVRVPSPEPVQVTLGPTGRLLLRGEPGEGGALWRARVLTADGRPLAASAWRRVAGTPWVLVTADGTPVELPPGSYRVEGVAPGGGRELHDVTVTAGGEVELRLGG